MPQRLRGEFQATRIQSSCLNRFNPERHATVTNRASETKVISAGVVTVRATDCFHGDQKIHVSTCIYLEGMSVGDYVLAGIAIRCKSCGQSKGLKPRLQ